MGRKNIIAGVILMIITLGYGYMTSQLPHRNIAGAPGISFFPWIITIGVFTLSLAMTIQGWMSIRQGETNVPWQAPAPRVIAMLVLYVVFITSLQYLGFLIASIPVFMILMALYGGRHKLMLILAGPIIPIAIFLLFKKVFLIPLPKATLSILGG